VLLVSAGAGLTAGAALLFLELTKADAHANPTILHWPRTSHPGAR
jgi:hypothetical protein